MSTPTQVTHKWRATVRTAFQAVVALAAMWTVVIEALGLGGFAWAASTVVVAAAITRLMALPQVEDFLTKFVPWLSATPPEPDPDAGRPDGLSDAEWNSYRQLFNP